MGKGGWEQLQRAGIGGQEWPPGGGWGLEGWEVPLLEHLLVSCGPWPLGPSTQPPPASLPGAAAPQGQWTCEKQVSSQGQLPSSPELDAGSSVSGSTTCFELEEGLKQKRFQRGCSQACTDFGGPPGECHVTMRGGGGGQGLGQRGKVGVPNGQDDQTPGTSSRGWACLALIPTSRARAMG